MATIQKSPTLNTLYAMKPVRFNAMKSKLSPTTLTGRINQNLLLEGGKGALNIQSSRARTTETEFSVVESAN